jgi:FkbM family methyltransferase
MFSKIGKKIYEFSKAIEQPVLFKLRRDGGIPSTYENLNTHWFESLNIDTVLDIGANIGQFTKTITSILPNAKIYSFEPLEDCFEDLEKLVATNSNLKVFNIGLGDENEILTFEQNEFSPSSSFLKMNDNHKNAFPFTNKTKTISIQTAKLDDIAKDLDLGKSLFIKIDVQGFEDKVLQGGKQTIQQAKLIIIETSFISLYESQPLFDDIYTTLKCLGFIYVGMIGQLSDPNTGKLIQGDATFVKPPY